MANDQELILKIKAETDKAIVDLKKLTGEIKTLQGKVDKSTKSYKANQTALDGIAKKTSSATTIIKGLVVSLGLLKIAMDGVEFAKLAADAEQASDAFTKVVTDMGADAEEEFSKIKEASKGLISEADIKQSATTALSLGVPLEKLSQLMEVARAKSREMGTDAKNAFNDLAKGIGRGSPLILDNLGLTIKLSEANQKMADQLGKTVGELSKEEKQLALTNAVIEAGAASVDRFADAGLSSKENLQLFNATMKDLKVEIGKGLLPVLTDLAKETVAFVESLTPADLERMRAALKNMGEAAVFLAKTLGMAAEGWAKIAIIVDAVINANDKYAASLKATDEILQNSHGTYKMTREELEALEETINAQIEDNDAWIESYSHLSGTTEQTKKLKDANQELSQKLTLIAGLKPYKKVEESANDAAEATDDLSDATKRYSEEELKNLEKANKTREKDLTRTIASLEKKEEGLVKDIVKLNQKLVKDLAKLESDRLKTISSINSKIRDISRATMDEERAYYDRRREAEEVLARAKEELAAGNFEMYRDYISQYEALITESAGQEIAVNDDVKVSKEATQRAAIDGLNKIKTLEEQYYTAKKAETQRIHDQAVIAKELEITATKAQLEVQKQLLEVVKQLVEALTGKEVDLDTSKIDAAIAKMNGLEGQLTALDYNSKTVGIDSTQVDAAKQKVESFGELTINDKTVEVTADTTPADFDIDRLETEVEKGGFVIKMSAEYKTAEAQINALRNKQESDPIDTKVDADTSAADNKIQITRTTAAQPTQFTVNADTAAAIQAIRALQVPTYSTHYVTVVTTNARADGGPIVKLADGGSPYRVIKGRVPGYDPTDSDKVRANLTGGEWVIKREAVDKYGHDFMAKLNSMQLPQMLANGGSVGVGNFLGSVNTPAPIKLAEGGPVSAPSLQTGPSKDLGTLTLRIGDQDFEVMTEEGVANSLAEYLKRSEF